MSNHDQDVEHVVTLLKTLATSGRLSISVRVDKRCDWDEPDSIKVTTALMLDGAELASDSDICYLE